jgi:hypothetical protein
MGSRSIANWISLPAQHASQSSDHAPLDHIKLSNSSENIYRSTSALQLSAEKALAIYYEAQNSNFSKVQPSAANFSNLTSSHLPDTRFPLNHPSSHIEAPVTGISSASVRSGTPALASHPPPGGSLHGSSNHVHSNFDHGRSDRCQDSGSASKQSETVLDSKPFVLPVFEKPPAELEVARLIPPIRNSDAQPFSMSPIPSDHVSYSAMPLSHTAHGIQYSGLSGNIAQSPVILNLPKIQDPAMKLKVFISC